MFEILGKPNWNFLSGYRGADLSILENTPEFATPKLQSLMTHCQEFEEDDLAFLKKMLHFDPNERWTCAELLEDSYLSDIKPQTAVRGIDENSQKRNKSTL